MRQPTEASDGRRDPENRQLSYDELRVRVGPLLSDIAHDMNGSLAAIAGFAELGLKTCIDPGIRQDLDRIRTEAGEAARRVARLKFLAGDHLPTGQLLDWSALVKETFGVHLDSLEARNIRAVAELDERLASVYGNRAQLVEVFEILLENACRSMARQGYGTLTVQARETRDAVELSLAAAGSEIPDQAVAGMFDPFSATRAAWGGAVLDLGFCSGIARAHGGSVWAENADGGGLKVTMSLPAAKPAELTLQGESGPSPAPAGPNLLVVDDEEAVLEVIHRLLTSAGYNVRASLGGRPAMEMLDLESFDGILLDFDMPVVGGREIYEHLRRQRLAARVLLVTGEGPGVREFVERTGSPVLAKPFGPKELFGAVEALVGDSRTGKTGQGEGPN